VFSVFVIIIIFKAVCSLHHHQKKIEISHFCLFTDGVLKKIDLGKLP